MIKQEFIDGVATSMKEAATKVDPKIEVLILGNKQIYIKRRQASITWHDVTYTYAPVGALVSYQYHLGEISVNVIVLVPKNHPHARYGGYQDGLYAMCPGTWQDELDNQASKFLFRPMLTTLIVAWSSYNQGDACNFIEQHAECPSCGLLFTREDMRGELCYRCVKSCYICHKCAADLKRVEIRLELLHYANLKKERHHKNLFTILRSSNDLLRWGDLASGHMYHDLVRDHKWRSRERVDLCPKCQASLIKTSWTQGVRRKIISLMKGNFVSKFKAAQLKPKISIRETTLR